MAAFGGIVIYNIMLRMASVKDIAEIGNEDYFFSMIVNN